MKNARAAIQVFTILIILNSDLNYYVLVKIELEPCKLIYFLHIN